jgi:hypothetical protein
MQQRRAAEFQTKGFPMKKYFSLCKSGPILS